MTLGGTSVLKEKFNDQDMSPRLEKILELLDQAEIQKNKQICLERHKIHNQIQSFKKTVEVAAGTIQIHHQQHRENAAIKLIPK